MIHTIYKELCMRPIEKKQTHRDIERSPAMGRVGSALLGHTLPGHCPFGQRAHQQVVMCHCLSWEGGTHLCQVLHILYHQQHTVI